MWFWFMKSRRHSKPSLNYNSGQEGQSLGEERRQAERLILLIRSAEGAGGLCLPFCGRSIYDVWRNVSHFSFESEETNHGRRNVESSKQKTVEGWQGLQLL